MSEFDLNCGKIQPPQQGLYQGAFAPDPRYGKMDFVTKDSLEAFENMSGAEVDIALKFLSFATGLDFPAAEAGAAARNGGAVFIKLEPFDPVSWKEHKKDVYPLKDIINGKYDHLLKNFAEGAKRFGKPVFVSFGHEMNGNWYPWARKPALFRQAYQRVHQVVSATAPNITWVWNPDIFSDPRSYYPGDAYVDWAAIDGYNWTGKKPAAEIFGQHVKQLKPFGKPIMIGEFACARDSAGCVTDFIDFVTHNKDLKAYVYFNKDEEKDGKLQKFSLKTPEERAAYQEAVKKNEALFKGRIQVNVCQQPAGTAPAQKADAAHKLVLGKKGQGELSRALVAQAIEDDKLPLADLEMIMEALRYVPLNIVLDPEVSRYSQEKFDRDYPGLVRIRQISQSLYWHLRADDFKHYWNNAILLFSIHAEKVLENATADKDQKIAGALETAKKFKQRIAIQAMVDRGRQVKRAASDYSLAVLDLTVAELYSQSKGLTEFEYQEGIRLAVGAITGLQSVAFNRTYPSKPDYFSIAKGVLILGDLYQQLGHESTDDSEKQEHYARASFLYGSIAAMQEETLWETGAGIQVILPDIGLHVDISATDINDGLEFNRQRGYMTLAEKNLAQVGMFLYLKGRAIIKQAGLFAGLPAQKGAAEYLHYLVQASDGVRLIREWSDYLVRYHGKDAAELTRKNEFAVNLAGLIQGELLLGLSDRLKYYADDELWWLSFRNSYEALSERIQDQPYAHIISALPYLKYPQERRQFANYLVRTAQIDYFYANENKSYPYLYAWSSTKQFEIAIRQADYIRSLDTAGRITTDPNKVHFRGVADIEELLKIHDEVRPKLSDGDFLAIELDFLKASLLLSGIPVRTGPARFAIASLTNREIKKRSKPAEVLLLLNGIKAQLYRLPELNRTYFSILLKIKEVQTMIQLAKDHGQKVAAARQTLELLQEAEKEIGCGLPTHISKQVDALALLIKKKQLKEAKNVVNVLRQVLASNSLLTDEIKGLIAQVDSALAKKDLTRAMDRATALQEKVLVFNDPAKFAPVSQALVWDMHALKAELYHQLAVNYAIIKHKTGPLTYEYAISAFLEAEKSSSRYDREIRTLYILADIRGLSQAKIKAFKKTYGEIE